MIVLCVHYTQVGDLETRDSETQDLHAYYLIVSFVTLVRNEIQL